MHPSSTQPRRRGQFAERQHAADTVELAQATTLPAGPRRPRAGSWLDVSAKRIISELNDKFGLDLLDSDEDYLTVAIILADRREAVARQLGITAASAQRYFYDEALGGLAASIAGHLISEKVGD